MADRVRGVQELRRSGAAGAHVRRPTRASELAFWIAFYGEDDEGATDLADHTWTLDPAALDVTTDG